jgi:hypothetical protein
MSVRPGYLGIHSSIALAAAQMKAASSMSLSIGRS